MFEDMDAKDATKSQYKPELKVGCGLKGCHVGAFVLSFFLSHKADGDHKKGHMQLFLALYALL